jgi:hypothetical protein
MHCYYVILNIFEYFRVELKRKWIWFIFVYKWIIIVLIYVCDTNDIRQREYYDCKYLMNCKLKRMVRGKFIDVGTINQFVGVFFWKYLFFNGTQITINRLTLENNWCLVF